MEGMGEANEHPSCNGNEAESQPQTVQSLYERTMRILAAAMVNGLDWIV